MVVGKEPVSPHVLRDRALSRIWDRSPIKIPYSPAASIDRRVTFVNLNETGRRHSGVLRLPDGSTHTSELEADEIDMNYLSVLTSPLDSIDAKAKWNGTSTAYDDDTKQEQEAGYVMSLANYSTDAVESPFGVDTNEYSWPCNIAPNCSPSHAGSRRSSFYSPCSSFQSAGNGSEVNAESSNRLAAEKCSNRPSLESLCCLGLFDSLLAKYLTAPSIISCKLTSATLHNNIHPTRFSRNLKDILLYHRRELGLGLLDEDENRGSGLIGGGFLDQKSIAALNATCREMKLATELVIHHESCKRTHPRVRHRTLPPQLNRAPSPCCVFDAETPARCSAQFIHTDVPLLNSGTDGIGTPSRATPTTPARSLKCNFITKHRCLVTPNFRQINFNSITSPATALSLLKRVDPRMITKIFGTLTFAQEGTRRQSAAMVRIEVTNQLYSTLRHMKNLTSIDIANWPINDQWLASFAESITESNAERINEIRLTYPAIDGTSSPTFTLSSASLTLFCAAVSKLNKLEVLDLSGIIIRDEITEPLVELTKKRSLKKLWLRSTKLGDTFLNRLCDSLRQQCKTTGSDSLFASQKKEVCGLTHVCLQHCLVTDKGVSTLVCYFDDALVSRSSYLPKRSRSFVLTDVCQESLSHKRCIHSNVLPRILLGSNRNVSREAKAPAAHLKDYISFKS